MKLLILIASALASSAAFANTNTQQYVTGGAGSAEIKNLLAEYKSTGTSPARVNHKHVFVPCTVTQGESSTNLQIGQFEKSFSIPAENFVVLKEVLNFDGEFAWSQTNYSWSMDETDANRVSFSRMGSSLVVLIDSAKCSLPRAQ